MGRTRQAHRDQPGPDASTADTTGSLLIEGEHSYEATVAVNGTGRVVGPYTDAAIHSLKLDSTTSASRTPQATAT